MFIVRRAQLAVLDRLQVRNMAVEVAPQLGVDSQPLIALFLRVREVYRVELRADLERLAAIARDHGFDFDARPENRWMVEVLTDPEVSSVSRRVVRLSEELARRAELARHNAALDAAIGIPRRAR